MNIVNYKELTNLKGNLSPSQLKVFDIKNKNTIILEQLLNTKLTKKFNGKEVGSINYAKKSLKTMIRAKALQSNYFIPILNESSTVNIKPQSFYDMELKKNDIVISKDSNIGEVIILDKDLPNHMLSGALYKLPIKENKLYIFSFIKSDLFKKQLDLIVPKGATIRHAKTLFLQCKIPFPNFNIDNTIKMVEIMTDIIISAQSQIIANYNLIILKIDMELQKQKEAAFIYQSPKLNDLRINKRLDTGIYCEQYKLLNFQINNYIYGAKTLNELGFEAVRGPNLAVSVIGLSIYSDKQKNNFYRLLQPTDLSEFGTIEQERYFGNRNQIQQLKQGDILFGAEGSIGKCHIICEDIDHAITNYHGMSIINKHNYDLTKKIFIGLFIMYLKEKKYFEFISVGGQGGSFGKTKTENIPIPIFPKEPLNEIVELYFSNKINKQKYKTIYEWHKNIKSKINTLGIIQLDKIVKQVKELLLNIQLSIAEDEEINLQNYYESLIKLY